MERIIEKARTLVEALPYIREFFEKTVVIKFGGSVLNDASVREGSAKDIVLMKYVGMNPVLVHGGGRAISEALDSMGIKSEFREGLRVTDERAVKIVEMVLVGGENKELVASINRAGGRAVGVSGKDSGMIFAEKLMVPGTTEGEMVDMGYVGRVTRVDPTVVTNLEKAGYIPVIAPVATDADGGTWNVNADVAAGEVAGALRAEKLVFLTDTPGVLGDAADEESLISTIAMDEVEELISRGAVSGGMIPKVKACCSALRAGVRKTHIIDGRLPHALLLGFFTDKGVGTQVTL
ncbi:MAG: acetylglutamate kinase [Candidatus Hydrogenedentes bacterium]|nr:acetylglutamate kinase [Candidatus Hydrogenedentota bacterium]